MKTRNRILEQNPALWSSAFTQIHVGSRTYIKPAEIVMITADISYSYIYLSDGKRLIVSTNIQKLQERLLGVPHLVRVHRSYIINVKFLQSFDDKHVALKNNLSCPVSRRKKINLENFLINFYNE
jgi:DNA-binding LytR/AlgR family response regulator